MDKGFVGRLTFRSDDDFEVLQHARFWPADLDDMTEEEWSREPVEKREGRSLDEALCLKRLYGTAVGAPVVHPDNGRRLGCVTIHTKSGDELPKEIAIGCAKNVVLAAREFAIVASTEVSVWR